VELQLSDLMVAHAKRTPNRDTSTTARGTCPRMAGRDRCSSRGDSEHLQIEPDLSSNLTYESLAIVESNRITRSGLARTSRMSTGALADLGRVAVSQRSGGGRALVRTPEVDGSTPTLTEGSPVSGPVAMRVGVG
jgi:hypothetical protein